MNKIILIIPLLVGCSYNPRREIPPGQKMIFALMFDGGITDGWTITAPKLVTKPITRDFTIKDKRDIALKIATYLNQIKNIPPFEIGYGGRVPWATRAYLTDMPLRLPFNKAGFLLGTTDYGDKRMNDEAIISVKGKQNSTLAITIAHEFGHALGFKHTNIQWDLMNGETLSDMPETRFINKTYPGRR